MHCYTIAAVLYSLGLHSPTSLTLATPRSPPLLVFASCRTEAFLLPHPSIIRAWAATQPPDFYAKPIPALHLRPAVEVTRPPLARERRQNQLPISFSVPLPPPLVFSWYSLLIAPRRLGLSSVRRRVALLNRPKFSRNRCEVPVCLPAFTMGRRLSTGLVVVRSFLVLGSFVPGAMNGWLLYYLHANNLHPSYLMLVLEILVRPDTALALVGQPRPCLQA